MKRFALLALLCAPLFAAGNVQQVTQQIGNSSTYVVSFTWTGDATTGSVPVTAAILPGVLQGYRIISCETGVGSPTPTNGYSLSLVDFTGVDLLAGAGAGVGTTGAQSFTGSPTAAPLFGTFSLTITGQNVGGAKGTTVVYLAPFSQVIGLSPTAPSFPSQGPNLQYSSPDGSSGSPGFRHLTNNDLPVVAPVQGGTGQTTLLAALQALLSGNTQGVNTNKVQMSTGVATNGDCLKYDASGNAIDSGGPCASAPVGTGPFQRFRSGISPFTGAFVADISYKVADFNYAAITPSGSPTINSGTTPTLTIAPCPLGFTGSGTYATPFYISGGVGTAESVLPTGGTCTSGAASGTIILATLANTHSGAYTLTASTSGLEEAMDYLAATGGTLIQFSGTITMHTKAEWVNSQFTLDGGSQAASNISRAADYPNNPLVHIQNANCCFQELKNFSMSNDNAGAQTNAAAISITAGGFITLQNINIFGGNTAISSSGGFALTNFTFSFGAHTNNALIVIFPNTGGTPTPTDIYVANGELFPGPNAIGIDLNACDGCTFENIQGSQGIPWFQANPSGTGGYVANLIIANNICDQGGATQYCFNFAGSASGTIGTVTMTGNKINGDPGQVNTTAGIVLTDSGVASSIGDIAISGGHIDFIHGSALLINGTVKNVSITGVKMQAVPTNGNETLRINGGSNISLNGNVVISSNTVGALALEGAPDKVTITGNTFTSGTSTPYRFGSIPTNFALGYNIGISNVVPNAASANPLPVPPNPFFNITGNTGFTTVSGAWAGMTWTAVPTAANVVATAGASVGNTCTMLQNKPYTLSFDGTKMWFNGSGC